MDNLVYAPITVRRPAGSTKSRRGRPTKNNSEANGVREIAGVRTLTRTKSLLNAALHVWALKQRIND